MSFDGPGAGRPEQRGEGGPRDERRPRRPGGRYVPRRKVCMFCVDKVAHVDYKDLGRLGRYVSDRGKIESRRKMGTCAKHQRSLAVALKRARHLALLPYTASHIRP
ncbi:MAG: 30S ribosomal protein S18 [Chloroflexota bacterium]|nr:30S ribosomal protein S18 [Chloroflexota bacterium]